MRIERKEQNRNYSQTIYRDWIAVYLPYFHFLLPTYSSAQCSRLLPVMLLKLIKDTWLPSLRDTNQLLPPFPGPLTSTGLDSAWQAAFPQCVPLAPFLPLSLNVAFNPLIPSVPYFSQVMVFTPSASITMFHQVTPNTNDSQVFIGPVRCHHVQRWTHPSLSSYL